MLHVNRAVCSLFIVQTLCGDMKPFAHFERERQRARGEHMLFVKWRLIESFLKNFFINLITKYELYLTFSIIIILHAPGRVWDCAAACRDKPMMEDSLRSVYENRF